MVYNLAASEVELRADDSAAIDDLDRPDGRGGADPATKTA